MTQVLYAALAGPATTSDLYTVDPVTAVMTSVGPIGFAVTGLAFDPTDGTLYGATSNHSAAHPAALISIDTATGAGTLIGDFGLGAFHTAHDIAFDSTGQLWGLASASPHDLWAIDKTTGAVTPIGVLSPDGGGGGLDFDGSDVLWQVANWNSNIDTIDTATGAQTIVTATSDPSVYAHSGKFDQFGLFWASYPGGSGSAAPNLATIDTATGTVTIVAAFSVPGVGGLAWGGAATPVLRAKFVGSPLAGHNPLVVHFTDQSTPGPSGPITGWHWDFGDGGSSSGQNPTHTYTSTGAYTVTLTVTGTAPDGTASTIKAHYVLVLGPAALYCALAGPNGTSDLYTVDPVTAVMASVGPIGFALTGLAQDPTTGIVYGSTSRRSTNNPESLVTIDANTGAGTLVGSYGLGSTHTAHDIAFDAAGQLWGWDSSNARLLKINKHTGSAVTVGSPTSSWSGGLDFSSDGTLWKIGFGNSGSIGTVNTTTGLLTTLGYSTSDGHSLHSGKFDATDLFWGSSLGGGGTAGANLVTVDRGTGTVTVIGAFSTPGVGAVAWLSPPPAFPDFTVTLVPNSINVSDGVHTLVRLNTHAIDGDTEAITLSALAPSGFTVTFPTNPITAGDIDIDIDIDIGEVAVGTYTITIHCVGTDNSHDVVLTVHVLTIVPGFHIGS